MRDRAREDIDGTQEPSPYRDFGDPTSSFGTENASLGNGSLRIADPVQPDPEVVRQLVDAMGDEARPAGPAEGTVVVPPAVQVPPARRSPDAAPGEDHGKVDQLGDHAEPLGMLPQAQRRNWPVRPNMVRRGLKGRRDRKPAAPAPGDDDQPVAVRPGRGNGPSSSTLGVAIAISLLVVFGIVALQFVISLVSSITSLFE